MRAKQLLLQVFAVFALAGLSPAWAEFLLPDPQGVSLNAALDQLKIVVPLRHDAYPFRDFSVAPDSKFIAVTLNRAVVPAGSSLYDEAVIINVQNRHSQVLAIIRGLLDERFASFHASGVQFINNDLVRTEFTGPSVKDAKHILRTYNFYDMKTKEVFAIESRLPFQNISDVRAFSKNHYLVRYFENGVKVNATVFFDAKTGQVRILDKPNDAVARELRRANADPGEDVWILSEHEVVIHIDVKNQRSEDAYTYFIGPVAAKAVAGHIGGLFDDSGNFVVNGESSLVLSSDDVISFSPNGEHVDGEWTQPTQDVVVGPFYHMGSFLVADFSDHPHYGWVKLSPNESAPQLITNPYFQLVRYEVTRDTIAGIGTYDALARDIHFYAIKPGNLSAPAVRKAVSTAKTPRKRLEVVPFHDSLPVVSAVDKNRFLFVQISPEQILILDRENPNQIVQSITLLDKTFRIKHINDKETLIHYPKLKKVVSYSRPEFELLRTMDESKCNHLLDPKN